MTKVLISGSRNWSDSDTIKKVIYSIPVNSILIVGDAIGADEIARECAYERGNILVREYKANWHKHGKRAGPMRNIEMFNTNPDEVYTFQVDDSKGTGHAIRLAEERNIKLTKFGMTAEENKKFIFDKEFDEIIKFSLEKGRIKVRINNDGENIYEITPLGIEYFLSKKEQKI